ncbi:MAG: hypothetical protein ACRDPF_39690 [Streptosporangiaceae bacterium]
MRKWTVSACVMLAWLILPLVAAAGSREPARTGQANISIASYTRATQASEPRAAAKAEVTADPAGSAVTWTVRPGDALSTIATLTAPGGAPAPAAGIPRWLEDVLLAAGVLVATVFVAEPAALARRRKVGRPAWPARRARSAGHRAPGDPRNHAREAAAEARIILADHERLIVTYCASDNTVYVLTPPGEAPRAILRAARLVLPEETYEDLADHLGVPSAWPLE